MYSDAQIQTDSLGLSGYCSIWFIQNSEQLQAMAISIASHFINLEYPDWYSYKGNKVQRPISKFYDPISGSC